MSSEGGYRGASSLLDKNCGATAYFCPNDITAIGVMRALKEHNLSIPEDVSLISIDDIETAQYLTPMLTTIHIPVDEMGQMTAKILIDPNRGGTHASHENQPPLLYCQSRELWSCCLSKYSQQALHSADRYGLKNKMKSENKHDYYYLRFKNNCIYRHLRSQLISMKGSKEGIYLAERICCLAPLFSPSLSFCRKLP